MKILRCMLAVALVFLFSGCLPMYYGTSVSPGEVVAGKSRKELAGVIGQPVRTEEFSPPVRLAQVTEFRRDPDPVTSRVRIRWRDEYLCRGNIRRETGGSGTLSERDMIYINTLGMSEVVAAPVIAGRDLVGTFQTHKLLVWSDVNGRAVFYTFDGD